ncbi:MAG: hypothetical protein M9894_39170 [Planctomycetes bacterium]|nr:hypothetical protein [Planctomycetota bacterium]
MSDATLFGLFFAALGVTVVLLGVALYLAHRHDARGHIKAVVGFVALLLVTLYFAEQLGRRFEFAETPKRIHLAIAFATAGFLVVPLLTGVQHWRGRMRRETHTRLAAVFLLLTASSVATGVWMLSTRTPAATVGAGAPTPD